MQKFQALTKYAPLIARDEIGSWVIDRENDGSAEHPIHIPVVSYSDMVEAFVRDVYDFCHEHPELGLTEYRKILKRNGLKCDGNDDLSDKDAQCVLALILCAVRTERFCTGTLMSLFKNGSMEAWLTRLLEIDGEGV